jgi:hypothetical protein
MELTTAEVSLFWKSLEYDAVMVPCASPYTRLGDEAVTVTKRFVTVTAPSVAVMA